MFWPADIATVRVLGARDPISGTVSLLETARGVAAAVARGYRPRRSTVFSSWGGEEFFLLGSTEWGEHFATELKKDVVAYLNRESYTSGTWKAEGSHALEPFVIETSRAAPHPEGQQPLRFMVRPRRGSQRPARRTAVELQITPVFLNHLGVPSLSFGYGSPNGIYHSLYDTFEYYQRFGDPGYHYGLAQADMVRRLIMRLANAEVLPCRLPCYCQYYRRLHRRIHCCRLAGQARIRTSSDERCQRSIRCGCNGGLTIRDSATVTNVGDRLGGCASQRTGDNQPTHHASRT